LSAFSLTINVALPTPLVFPKALCLQCRPQLRPSALAVARHTPSSDLAGGIASCPRCSGTEAPLARHLPRRTVRSLRRRAAEPRAPLRNRGTIRPSSAAAACTLSWRLSGQASNHLCLMSSTLRNRGAAGPSSAPATSARPSEASAAYTLSAPPVETRITFASCAPFSGTEAPLARRPRRRPTCFTGR